MGIVPKGKGSGRLSNGLVFLSFMVKALRAGARKVEAAADSGAFNRYFGNEVTGPVQNKNLDDCKRRVGFYDFI